MFDVIDYVTVTRRGAGHVQVGGCRDDGVHGDRVVDDALVKPGVIAAHRRQHHAEIYVIIIIIIRARFANVEPEYGARTPLPPRLWKIIIGGGEAASWCPREKRPVGLGLRLSRLSMHHACGL